MLIALRGGEAGVDGVLVHCGSDDLLPRCQLFSSFNLTSLTTTSLRARDQRLTSLIDRHAQLHIVDVPHHNSTSVYNYAANVVPLLGRPHA